MNQRDLFTDAQPLTRRDDPETSRAAAEEIAPQLGSLHRDILACLRGWFDPPPTSRELGVHMNREVWRRMGELETKGLVIRSKVRRCRISGKFAATWWPKGKRVPE